MKLFRIILLSAFSVLCVEFSLSAKSAQNSIWDTSYSKVAFKASHNSYDRDESLAEQLTFTGTCDGGCSGIELDIWQDKDSWKWSVSHLGGYNDSENKQLSSYLKQVLNWRNSAASRPNDNRVITIYLDIKNKPMGTDNFPEQLDAYIRSCFNGGSTVFKPAELIGNHKDLVSGAQADGWPELQELNGKYIFVLTGDEEIKAAYSDTKPKERLCFADIYLETDPPEYPNFYSGNRIFMNYHLYSHCYDEWYFQLNRMADEKGFVTRGYVLNSESIWDKALSANLNIMSTDKVNDHEWAQTGSSPFIKLKNTQEQNKQDALQILFL